MLEGPSSCSVGRPGVRSPLPKDSEPHTPAGTYTFFAGIKVPGEFGEYPDGYVITRVTVTDAANGL